MMCPPRMTPAKMGKIGSYTCCQKRLPDGTKLFKKMSNTEYAAARARAIPPPGPARGTVTQCATRPAHVTDARCCLRALAALCSLLRREAARGRSSTAGAALTLVGFSARDAPGAVQVGTWPTPGGPLPLLAKMCNGWATHPEQVSFGGQGAHQGRVPADVVSDEDADPLRRTLTKQFMVSVTVASAELTRAELGGVSVYAAVYADGHEVSKGRSTGASKGRSAVAKWSKSKRVIKIVYTQPHRDRRPRKLQLRLELLRAADNSPVGTGLARLDSLMRRHDGCVPAHDGTRYCSHRAHGVGVCSCVLHRVAVGACDGRRRWGACGVCRLAGSPRSSEWRF